MRPLLLTLLLLPACQRGEPLAGDGAPLERAWVLPEVTGLVVSGPVSVQVLAGPAFAPGVRVEGDANLVGALHRSMTGRTLTLDASHLSPSLPLTVTVTTPRLDAVTASDRAVVSANAMHGGRLTLSARSSARVLVNGVDADSLVVVVSQTSTVDAAGRARLVDVQASDVGTAALGSLSARVALVQATELSTVTVHAREALRGEATRSSRVVVTGAPPLRSLAADDSSFVKSESRPPITADTAGPGPDGA